MADLRTQYLGLELKNPIIVSSCDLTSSVENIVKAEEAGAAAVVLKSIFEEQFLLEGGIDSAEKTIYPEARDYLQSRALLGYAPAEMLKVVERAKKRVSIPIIASFNCQTAGLWPELARQLASAGADAIELNIYTLPVDLETSSQVIEKRMEEIVLASRQAVNLPMAVKLPFQVTALPHLVYRLQQAGAKGVVLFNWFLESEVNLSRRQVHYFRGHGQLSQVLRWVGLMAKRVKCDLAASGGVTTAEAAIKLILVGAKAVQVCRLVYERGFQGLRSLIDGIDRWLTSQGYSRLAEAEGELSWKELSLSYADPQAASGYFRVQYMKAYTGAAERKKKRDSEEG